MTETLQNESQLHGYKSRKTLYNVTSKAWQSLPQSPEKFARVINSLVKNTTPRKRRFFVVKSGEVNRKRNITDVKTLNSCRKLHQFVNTSTTYQLLVKRLSCYCANCRHGREEECPNKMYTGEYKERSLKPTNVWHHQLPKTRSAHQSTPESPQNTSSPPRLSETCSGQQEALD